MNTLLTSNSTSLAQTNQTLSVRDKNDGSLEHMKYVEKQKKLSRIKNDKGEAADQQRRQLQLQLSTLNASMLDLLGKKLDAI